MFETELWKSVFRNNNVDVRPYFFYSEREGRKIKAHFDFLGYGEKKISEITNELNKKMFTHIGGVDAKLVEIHSRKKRFERPELEDEIRLDFISPIAIESKNDGISLIPNLSDISAGLVRNANRFSKYYAKACYPIRISSDLKNMDFPIIESNLRVFTWKHRAPAGRTIALKGVWGKVKYDISGANKELKDILALASFFHVGKWLSYGFGKIEVVEK